MKKKNYIAPFMEQTAYVMFNGLCASPTNSPNSQEQQSGNEIGGGMAPKRNVF